MCNDINESSRGIPHFCLLLYAHMLLVDSMLGHKIGNASNLSQQIPTSPVTYGLVVIYRGAILFSKLLRRTLVTDKNNISELSSCRMSISEWHLGGGGGEMFLTRRIDIALYLGHWWSYNDTKERILIEIVWFQKFDLCYCYIVTYLFVPRNSLIAFVLWIQMIRCMHYYYYYYFQNSVLFK